MTSTINRRQKRNKIGNGQVIKTNVIVKDCNSSYAQILTTRCNEDGKSKYECSETLFFKHSSAELIKDTVNKLKYVFTKVIKACTDYFDKNMEYHPDESDFSTVRADDSSRTITLQNEINFHNCIHSTIGMTKIDETKANLEKTKVQHHLKRSHHRQNNKNNTPNGNYNKKNSNNKCLNRLVIDPISSFDINHFPIESGLGYMLLTFCFSDNKNSTTGNNNRNISANTATNIGISHKEEECRLKKMYSIFSKSSCSGNVFVEKVYSIGSNNYCIVVSSFDIEMKIGINYDFGYFAFHNTLPSITPNGTTNTISGLTRNTIGNDNTNGNTNGNTNHNTNGMHREYAILRRQS